MSSPFNALGRLFHTDRRAPATTPTPVPKPPATPVDPARDSLTGLYSATGIEAELDCAMAVALESKEHIAVGFVTLDGLHEIHEEYGRMISDQIVRELGKRIRECVREHDAIGRITGEDFLVIFRGLTGRLETLTLVSRLRVHLAEPIRAGKITYEPLTSCGVAHHPADGATVKDLIDKAEVAMETMMVAVREAAERKRIDDAERAAREAAERVAAAEAKKAAEVAAEAAPAEVPVES